ncbi:mediator of RNA polymerase II transcription subunit 11-like [Xenia sp. Carnegie-2017]|uniref:mediator of RNA polymerase II transcription subunit 11-like n=1 Tax=Xenia sp. Carnegie-2017 TaxID=2897299 RepID=UPI001F04FFB7|nr:mediator of RNA polymerase II transcription subunit 11-like [Xenia sp. Carnegie-2017]
MPEIVLVVSNAGHALKEISKEIPSEETFKTYTQQFLNSLQSIEKGLQEQITYLSEVATGQPHEGSIYAAEKDFSLICQGTHIAKQHVEGLVKISKHINGG